MATQILRDVVDVQRFNTYLSRALGNGELESVNMALVYAQDGQQFLRHISSLGLSPEKVMNVSDALQIAHLSKNKER